MKNKIIFQIVIFLILGINQSKAQPWWNQTGGNAGTSPGATTDYVGTPDALPLYFSTNAGNVSPAGRRFYV